MAVTTDKPTLDQVIDYLTHRLEGMTTPGAVRMTTAARDYLVELRDELEQVRLERDTAVEYLRGQCRYCKSQLVCTSRKGPHSNCWEWRGQKED